MRQRLMESMHTLLRQRVEPYISENETWTNIINTAERCDAVLFRTGAYGQTKKPAETKGQSSKGKQAQAKPQVSSQELQKRRTNGECYNCGKKGHMSKDCPSKRIKKEYRSNRAEESDEDEEDINRSSKDDTSQNEIEEIQVNSIVVTNRTSNHGSSRQPALEGTILINGHKARVLFDTGTVGTDLISNTFITTHGIPTTELKNPANIRMAVKGSRCSAHRQCMTTIRIGKIEIKDNPMTALNLDSYDALLGMEFLAKHGAMIDCSDISILFPKYKTRILCKASSNEKRSAMTKEAELP